MNKVTEADFGKVRRLIERIQYYSKTLSDDSYLRDQHLRVAVDDAIPVVRYLVDYYYQNIDHTGDEVVTGPGLPEGTPKKMAVLKGMMDRGYRAFNPFPDENPNLLLDAMQHHEEATRKKEQDRVDTVQPLLDRYVGELKGHELLSLLDEFDRRRVAN